MRLLTGESSHEAACRGMSCLSTNQGAVDFTQVAEAVLTGC